MVARLTFPLKIGDKEYVCSALNDEGRENLDGWLRAQYVERAAAMIEALTNESDKRLALEVAFKEASKITFVSRLGAEFLATVDGMTRLMYESIKPNQPDVTHKELRELFLNPKNVRLANAVFKELNTAGTTGGPAEADSKRPDPKS